MAKSAKDKGDASPSLRLLRVNENLRHAISEVLMRGDIRDPLLEKISVTISEVQVSADLRHAIVFIMPLGGVSKTEILESLNNASKYIRGQVGKKVRMKYLPRFIFRLDESFDEASHIANLLNNPKVSRDIKIPSTEDTFSGRLNLEDDD